jgi:hypothetical protein
MMHTKQHWRTLKQIDNQYNMQEKLTDLDQLEAYFNTFKGRCGIQSVGYGNWQDIIAAMDRGIVTPCLWFETERERAKWDSGRLLEAEFRMLVLEGSVSNADDTKGVRALQRAAKQRLLPHKHKAIAQQQDTIWYQMQQDSVQMDFKLSAPEPLQPELKEAYGENLLCGVYLEKVRIAIVSPFQDTYLTDWI